MPPRTLYFPACARMSLPFTPRHRRFPSESAPAYTIFCCLRAQHGALHATCLVCRKMRQPRQTDIELIYAFHLPRHPPHVLAGTVKDDTAARRVHCYMARLPTPFLAAAPAAISLLPRPVHAVHRRATRDGTLFCRRLARDYCVSPFTPLFIERTLFASRAGTSSPVEFT